jgi:hypothetical protein
VFDDANVDANLAMAAAITAASRRGAGLRHSSGRIRNTAKKSPANVMKKSIVPVAFEPVIEPVEHINLYFRFAFIFSTAICRSASSSTSFCRLRFFDRPKKPRIRMWQ